MLLGIDLFSCEPVFVHGFLSRLSGLVGYVDLAHCISNSRCYHCMTGERVPPKSKCSVDLLRSDMKDVMLRIFSSYADLLDYIDQKDVINERRDAEASGVDGFREDGRDSEPLAGDGSDVSGPAAETGVEREQADDTDSEARARLRRKLGL